MMLNKELIIQVFENHSMKAKVYGALTNLIPETEYREMAKEILLLLQPIEAVPPQLQQHDVSGRSEQVCHICGGENGHTIECTSWCGNTVTV